MISFIVPAKNEEGYIIDCLESIFSQRTSEKLEVIMVDNDSSDGTSILVKAKYPLVKIVEEALPGTLAARQRGYKVAQGEVLVFLDADVRLPNAGWLDKLIEKISSPKVVAVSTHYRYYGLSFHQRLLQTLGTFCFVYPWVYFMNNILHHSAHLVGGMTAVKKSALDQVDGLGQGTEFFGDEALLCQRLYPLGGIIVSPFLWVYTSGRRYNKNGMVKTVIQYLLNYFWVIFAKKPLHKQGYKSVR